MPDIRALVSYIVDQQPDQELETRHLAVAICPNDKLEHPHP